MGFLTFIQRKTNPKKYSQPPRKAPPYECKISPKSPVRLVHPTSSTVSRNGSAYSHLPLPDRASLFPAHDVEPRSHSSPGLPLTRLGNNTRTISSRPRSSLADRTSHTGNPLPQPMPSHRPQTSLSSKRLSSFTSAGRCHIDLLDAQSEFKPDFYGRARASGVREYGEDVADRNIGVNGSNLGSPLARTFSFNSSDAGQTDHTPRRHMSLSGRSGHDVIVRLEAAPKPPRLARKKNSICSSSISSFAMQSLADLDAILLPEMEPHRTGREHVVSMVKENDEYEDTSLRLENNNSTDSFACPPPIRRSPGSRASMHISKSPSQNSSSKTETPNQLQAVLSNQTQSILPSVARAGSPNKQPTAANAMQYDGQHGVLNATTSRTKSSFDSNDDCEDDAPGQESEDTASSHASSLRHWSTTPLTPTTSSSNSESTLRTPSRHTANTSIELGKAVFSPVIGPEDKKQTSCPTMHDAAFNIDDYVVADDESLLGEDQPESEDLLFTPSFGKFGVELPGLQDMFMAPVPSHLLRSLGACGKTKTSSEDDLNSECPPFCVSQKAGFGQ